MSKNPTIVANPNWNAKQNTAFERLDAALPVAISYLSGEIPVLDNHTDEMLVDEVGDLKKVKKVFETAEKAHVERLKARMGDRDVLLGDIYEAKYRGSKRTILNQGLCKEVIAAFDEEGIHIQRLLAAIQSGQIKVPENVVLKPFTNATDTEEAIPGESNFEVFHTTSDGGRALYVEVIA